jgi:AcrR family transcriptional regulator
VALSRDRVLRVAVALADEGGIESLSMRKLAHKLRVVPMALYKHVADKEELLDGMVDVVVGEIDPPATGIPWRNAIRQRILSARRALLRHPWSAQVIESRRHPTPVVLAYLDSTMGMFREAGFSVDLTHHALHTLGSRLYGFTQEVFNDKNTEVDVQATVAEMQGKYPHIVALASSVYHDDASVVGRGCDDQFEFEFALDLLLEGIERSRDRR